MAASGLTVEVSRRRAWLLAALIGVMVVVTAFVPPVPQDPAYHHFADVRPALGVPNFLNVVSNLAFLVVGVLGLGFLARAPGEAGVRLSAARRSGARTGPSSRGWRSPRSAPATTTGSRTTGRSSGIACR